MEKKKKSRDKKKKKKKKQDPNDPIYQELQRLKQILKGIGRSYKREDFAPLSVIAKILDPYSGLKKVDLRKEVDQLEVHKKELRSCIKKIVDDNYSGFNLTIKNFSDVLGSFDKSRSNITRLIDGIEESEDLLTLDTELLNNLFLKFKQNKAYIEVLRELREIRDVPDQMKRSLEEHHYLHCVNLIRGCEKKLNKKKFSGILALDNTKRYLNETIEALPEILFEELNDFCYNCTTLTIEENAVIKPQKVFVRARRRRSRGSKRLSLEQRRNSVNNSIRLRYPEVKDNPNIKIEKNGGHFPRMIIETLYKLAQLRHGQNRLDQSLETRLTNLIRRHIEEFVAPFKITDEAARIKEMMADETVPVLKKILAQKELLSGVLQRILDQLLCVLKNFKFINEVFRIKSKQMEEQNSVQNGLLKEKKIQKEKLAKPTSEGSILNQRMTKDSVMAILKTVRLKLDELKLQAKKGGGGSNFRSSSSSVPDNPTPLTSYGGYLQEFIDSIEDILENFIEKITRQNDVSNMRVKIIHEMFVDKFKTEIQLSSDYDGEDEGIRHCEEMFKNMIIDALSNKDNFEGLKLINIWILVQKVLKREFLTQVLEFDDAIKRAKKAKVITLKREMKVHFSFFNNQSGDSNVMYTDGMEDKKEEDKPTATTNPLEEYFIFTPYNFIWVCKLVDSFVNEAFKILKYVELLPSMNILAEYVSIGIEIGFLETVDKDYRKLLKKNMYNTLKNTPVPGGKKKKKSSSERKFKPIKQVYNENKQVEEENLRDVVLDDQARCLKNLVKEVMFFISTITHPNNSPLFYVNKKRLIFKNKFFGIVGSLFSTYLLSIQKLYRRLIKTKWLKRWMVDRLTEILPVVKNDPVWKTLYDFHVSDDMMNIATTNFEKKIFVIFDSSLLTLDVVHKQLLITHTSEYIALAHIHTMVEWVADFITKVSVSTRSVPVGLRGVSRDEIKSNKSVRSNRIFRVNRETGELYDFQVIIKKPGSENEEDDEDDGSRTLKMAKIVAPQQIRSISQNYRLTSDIALFSMKLDIRCHSYFHLQKMVKSNYDVDEVPTEPENFVQTLNNDINRLERSLLAYLPGKKVKYLFHGLGDLYKQFFCSALEKFRGKKINENGLKQIKRNVNALQLNLNSILEMENFQGREKKFSDILHYYDLITLEGEKLYFRVKELIETNAYRCEHFEYVLEIRKFSKSAFKTRVQELLYKHFHKQ